MLGIWEVEYPKQDAVYLAYFNRVIGLKVSDSVHGERTAVHGQVTQMTLV